MDREPHADADDEFYEHAVAVDLTTEPHGLEEVAVEPMHELDEVDAVIDETEAHAQIEPAPACAACPLLGRIISTVLIFVCVRARGSSPFATNPRQRAGVTTTV